VVCKVLAKTSVLMLLYFADTPANEFRIRCWYNVSWLRERFRHRSAWRGE
jgi:hypothetical protein